MCISLYHIFIESIDLEQRLLRLKEKIESVRCYVRSLGGRKKSLSDEEGVRSSESLAWKKEMMKETGKISMQVKQTSAVDLEL